MKTTSRRADSLIPLSREHQYALLLCLRIHRGLIEHQKDSKWQQTKAAHAVRFFDGDLVTHFCAEEESLFPAMNYLPGAAAIIHELLAEHRRIGRLIHRLRQVEAHSLAATLEEFADTLEAHIRKEERELFPIYEQHAAPETMSRVEAAILKAIGSAAKPRTPELLT
jgi:iron-sulfur cluster repair protein YtfE (RIC family)